MSDKTVKVGCRMPSGVILRASDWADGPDGKFLKEVGTFELAGSGAHLGQGGALHAEGDEEGETYTEVPADLWDKWLANNKDSELLSSGAVFLGKPGDKTPEQQAEADAKASAADAGKTSRAKAS
jgi:hypothetical protein